MNRLLLLCMFFSHLNHSISMHGHDEDAERTVFGRRQDDLEESIASKARRGVSDYLYISGNLATLHRSSFFRMSYRKEIPLFNMLDSSWVSLSRDEIFAIIDNPNSSEYSHTKAFNRLVFAVENELYYFTSPSRLSQSELMEGSELISYFSKLLLWNSTAHDPERHLECNGVLSKILSFSCGIRGARKPYANFLERAIFQNY